MQDLRASLRIRGVSKDAAELILQSWSPATRKQYQSAIDKWSAFCSARQIPCHSPPLTAVLDFLTEQFNTGLSTSTMGILRSALSAFLPQIDGNFVGNHPLVCRLIKGVRTNRPILPKYDQTWDTDSVINFIRENPYSDLKDLSPRLAILLALVTAQRVQTLSKLCLSGLKISETEATFQISEPLKNRREGAVVTVRAFPDD